MCDTHQLNKTTKEIAMGMVFTPFALIKFLVLAIWTVSILYSAYKGHYKTSGILFWVLVLILIFQPVKLTIDSSGYDNHAASKMHEHHKEAINQLPPKYVDPNSSYEDTLKLLKKGN